MERLLWAAGINLVLAIAAWRVRSVTAGGAAMGFALGVVIYVCLDWMGFVVLGAFFVLGSVLTKIGYSKKEKLGAAQENKGARGPSHALANAGLPALMAALWTVKPIGGLETAFVAAFATAAMDTAGSEVGPVLGRRTVSLKNFKPVPPGTEGAVSLEGTLAGLAAAILLGLCGFLTGLIPGQHVWAVAAGALAGNLYEGVLGSRKLLSHGWLNLTNTLVGALIAWVLVR